jgi:hypothetical protein
MVLEVAASHTYETRCAVDIEVVALASGVVKTS